MTINLKKGRSKRGLPKRVSRSGHQARYSRYLTRSTCALCKLVFRSPDKRKAHVESGHKSKDGVNTERRPKSIV